MNVRPLQCLAPGRTQNMKYSDYIKPGDYIKYHFDDSHGVVLSNNLEGGTLKIYDTQDGITRWVVTSQCEIISEAR